MRAKFIVQDSNKHNYESKKGKGTLHQIIVSEAPGKDRLNGELKCTLTDEDAGRVDVHSLVGKTVDLVIKELSVGYGGKLEARVVLPHLENAKA